MRFVVTCRGTIDGAALSRIDLDVTRGGSGGTIGEGEPLPDQPQRFQFRVEAESPEKAIEQVRKAVSDAGGFCDGYEAKPAS